MSIENTILLKLKKAGGMTERRDVMRSLQRYKAEDKAKAFRSLEGDGFIKIETIVHSGPGMYRKRITLTEAGAEQLQKMIDVGLVKV